MMTKYTATVKLTPITDDGFGETILNISGHAYDHPADAIKCAGKESINILKSIATTKDLPSHDCKHDCSCKNTFCCVCDYHAIADDQAYHGGYACMMRPKEESSHE